MGPRTSAAPSGFAGMAVTVPLGSRRTRGRGQSSPGGGLQRCAAAAPGTISAQRASDTSNQRLLGLLAHTLSFVWTSPRFISSEHHTCTSTVAAAWSTTDSPSGRHVVGIGTPRSSTSGALSWPPARDEQSSLLPDPETVTPEQSDDAPVTVVPPGSDEPLVSRSAPAPISAAMTVAAPPLIARRRRRDHLARLIAGRYPDPSAPAPLATALGRYVAS